MTEETGTLAELNVKPGDMVECVGWSDDDSDLLVGEQYTIMEKHPLGHYSGLCAVRDFGWTPVDEVDPTMLFRIVSRATPKTWGEMTDEEKGALLLAEHEGTVIEHSHNQGAYWKPRSNDLWHDKHCYRVRPPEPKRETISVIIWDNEADTEIGTGTIEMIDGKPDCASICMEEL